MSEEHGPILPAPWRRRRSLIAVTASLAVTALIYGLTMPLLALVLERQGVEHGLIGVNTAMQSLAVFLIAPVVPRLMRGVGAPRLMLAAVIASAAMLLLMRALPDVYIWFPLRFALGAAGSMLWIAGETWVNQIAGDANRGRVVAFFNMAIMGGFALGPLILTVTGTEGWSPFVVSAAIMAAAAAPLFFVLDAAPAFAGRPSASLVGFLRLAPVAMFVCLAFAASEGAMLTFLPIYGLRVGLGESAAVTVITVLGVGGIAMQIPIGWLADRVERRLLTALCVLAASAGAAAMPFVLPHPLWTWLYIFVLGGLHASLYTLGMVLLGERFRGADLASASTLFGVMWGLGAILGPPIGGLGMELYPPHGVPAAVALILFVYLPLPVLAYLRRRRAAP